jgi:serine phosphatase RsbU (regulator of sigma subunit)
MNLGAFDFLTKPINFQDLEITTYKTLQHVQQIKQALAQENYLKRLEAENLRLSTELDITRRLQQMLLPTETELRQIQGLDIAGYMQPADEVGGDYYDVLEHNGTVKIGIGDITGHGLESGVLMLMVQTAVRTLLINNETNAVNFLSTLNQTIYQNLQRMGCDKNLSLALIDYHQGVLTVSGQHEQMIVLRSNGTIERIDTIDLGFPIGLAETIAEFVAEATVQLYPGDGVVLYTDGITEAEDMNGVQYGLERLCEVLRTNWHSSACEIRQAVIDQVWQHIGEQKVHDDITLLILKQQ